MSAWLRSVKDVGVSSLKDSQSRASMISAACCSQGGVVSLVEDDLGLGKDCVVFDFSLSDNWTVIREKDEFGIPGAKSSEGGLVA